MPQFAPSEEKVAVATFPVMPAGLECTGELWLASDTTPVATSGEIPFVATGLDQSIALPITMPGIEGVYPVNLGVFSGGVLIKSFRAVEDVVIAPIAPANLLLNPGFEDDFVGWTPYSNYPGRFLWQHSGEHARTGLYSAVAAGSVSGRRVVATLSQVVPWKEEYKGQTFWLAVWKAVFLTGTAHGITGVFSIMIDDGISTTVNESYVGGMWEEQAVTKTLSPYANKLEVIFLVIPNANWHSAGLYLDDAILEEV